MWTHLLRRLLLSGVILLAFAACSSGGDAPGSDNSVIGNVSPTGPVSVYLNKAQSLTISFSTSDGAPATDFSASASLAALPAGWTGPAGDSNVRRSGRVQPAPSHCSICRPRLPAGR